MISVHLRTPHLYISRRIFNRHSDSEDFSVTLSGHLSILSPLLSHPAFLVSESLPAYLAVKNCTVSVAYHVMGRGFHFSALRTNLKTFCCLRQTNLDLKPAQDGVILKDVPLAHLCLTCTWGWITTECRAVPITGEEQAFSHQ